MTQFLFLKAFREYRKHHQYIADGTGQSNIQIEQNKMLLSKPPHTVIDSRTMMVHLDYAKAAS